jgi:hypothetical protein
LIAANPCYLAGRLAGKSPISRFGFSRLFRLVD